MPLDPSIRDWISLHTAKHRPVFCYSSGSGAREITLEIQKGAFPLQKRTENVNSLFRVISHVQGKSLLGVKKGRSPTETYF